ncbi:MAG: hypothetical protein ABSE49_18700 [Polyangiaceae bacterium]|jgi:hypothetical protein
MTMSKSTKKPSTPSTTTPSPAPVAPAPPDANAALAAVVQQALTQLTAIETSLGSGPPLTALQKRHAARMRKGGAAIVATIAALTTKTNLAPPALSVASMTAQAGAAATLQPLAEALAQLTQRVEDLVFAAQSSAWVSATKFYAILRREAPSDPSLVTALQPVTQFFAYRHPTVKAAGTPTKRQKKATKQAEATLAKDAPQDLVPEAPATPATAAAASPAAPAVAPAPKS